MEKKTKDWLEWLWTGKKRITLNKKVLNLQVQYGDTAELEDRKRLKNFLRDMLRTIEYKNSIKEQHCTIEVPNDLRHKWDVIIKFFKMKGCEVDECEKRNWHDYSILKLNWRDHTTLERIIDLHNGKDSED